ncbi:carbohydrate ABC transporter permease [Vallitalea guaymasensis]|uniref:Sugar ABC transporter permease n=1 Tax=Vallitalea guaymasensis TaxID=1185412 RepID=A0A8J8SA55_9FIRM|nr:sugar ABC transporter permease [Vallitalea guaymasensis]QUH27443.1 sugar ABC transporter permease [Vallitalea guaymasensis]
MQKQKAKMGYIFIIPSIVLVLVFIVYPVINTINMSLYDLRIQTLAEGKKFVGFDNYIKLFSDKTFIESLKFTLMFTVVAVTLETLIGMIFALIMNKAIPGQGIIRTAVLVPWAIPTIVSGLMWQFMYSDQYGIINLILSKLHLIQDYIPWLIEKNTAIIAVIIADVWKTTPYMSLLILSGLQTVPESLYEAASLDGANKIQRFFRITLPIIKPVVVVAILFRVLATFRIYDLVVALTSGGPADGTQSLSLYTIKTYFNFGNLGYGATLAVVTFIISLLISFLFMDALKTKMEKV